MRREGRFQRFFQWPCVLLLSAGCNIGPEEVPADEPAQQARQELRREHAPLSQEEVNVLRKVLHAFVALYGEQSLSAEGAARVSDFSALEERLEQELTKQERAVLAQYARRRAEGEVHTLADPLPSTFYAVGDGKVDNSSDFYRFEVQNFQMPMNIFGTTVYTPASRVINFVKIGETGTILYDVAYLYNGGQPLIYAIGTSRLYQINVNTGQATTVGSSSLGYYLSALEECGGTLYGWGGSLVRINTSTGAATFIGNVGYSASGDLACEPWPSNQLFGTAQGSSESLIRLDRSTGMGTWVSNLSLTNLYGLSFGQNGYLHLGAHQPSKINVSLINPATGATLYVGLDYTTEAGLYGMTAQFIPY